MAINSLEYKMARRLQAKDHQMEKYKEHEAKLERHTALRTGYNNAIRALDHVIFDDENIDNFISSYDESAAKRPNNEPQEKTASKRHNNGNSEKWNKKGLVCKEREETLGLRIVKKL